jgi:preprotein translocase subunit SecA
MRYETITEMVEKAIPKNSYAEQWDAEGLTERCRHVLGIDVPVADWAQEEGIAEPEIEERIRHASDRKMAEKAANFGPEAMRMVEKSLLLQILDQIWKEHLLQLDHLRQGISLRAYAQRDPLREYQSEAFELFHAMLANLRETVTRVLAVVELRTDRPEDVLPQRPSVPMRESRRDPAMAMGAQPAEALAGVGGDGAEPPPAAAARSGDGVARGAAPPVRRAPPPGVALDPANPETWGKVPRNAPCPCGSGRKYKHCHGALSESAAQ